MRSSQKHRDDPTGIALVTGARRGIGSALAVALAEHGRTIYLHIHEDNDVSRAQAESVISRMRHKGAEAEIIAGDLSSDGIARDLVHRIIGRHGRLDVLVNNAARASNVPVEEITVSEWEKTLRVNLTAPFILAQAVLPGMIERQWGRVINVSSITEVLGGPSGVAYVSSKGGLVAMTRALARNLKTDGVTVNALSPGAVLTEQEHELYSAEHRAKSDREVLANQALPRRLVPDDLISALRFLIDPGSNAVTGQVIEVNGGWYFR